MKTLFYFYAPWCTGCQSLGPVIDQVSAQGIPVQKINIDYEIDKAYSAKVSSVPTVVLVSNGNEIKRFTGPRQLNEVISFYNS